MNLDTSTLVGIKQAKKLGLVPSGLADVITSDRIQLVQLLFDSTYLPTMFTLIRHPYERLRSLFFFLKKADWARNHNEFHRRFGNLTFYEYLAKDNGVDHNWMTTSLVNVRNKHLNDTHVSLATQILNKSLIGLTEAFETSIQRFQKYFGWNKTSASERCIRKLVKYTPVNAYNFGKDHITENSEWNF